LEKEGSETYLNKLKQLSKEELLQIQKDLSAFNSEFKTNIRRAGATALQLIKQSHLSDENFNYGKTGPQNVFKKWDEFKFDKLDELSGSRLSDALRTGKWQSTKNSAAENEAISRIAPRLTEIGNETLAYLKENGKQFALSRLLEKNIYAIILVNELQQIAEEFKREEQIVFISEFNTKIAKIVSEEPAPFIYERLGERYSHFLLDEFQDTSTLQWLNILPLIDNSLAAGKFNLIVGDGKQSIYRWRNANVKQFNALPALENNEGNGLLTERQEGLARNYKPAVLNTNYRSLGEVVEFNNSVFGFLADHLLKNELRHIYDEQAQQKRFPDGGYVSVQAGDTEKSELDDTTCKLALEHIRSALAYNFSYSDVCIIIRNNRQGNTCANYLIKQSIPVISSDSLLLRNCPEVNCVIAFLTYLINPADKISAATVINYLHYAGTYPAELSDSLKLLSMQRSLFDVLDTLHIHTKAQHFSQKNVFDSCVEIISILGLNKQNAQYMRFFLDEVNDYLVNKTGSVTNFLEWWEKRSEIASVIIPEGTNAVRIMTIHKSKGLEFPVVILPYVNWETYKPSSSWVNLEDRKAGLPAGLFSISSSIAEAGFEHILSEEQNDQVLDNLNLLYVAFTRAAERLHVITLKSKSNRKETVAKWIGDYLTHSGAAEGALFERGTLQNKQHASKKEQSAVFAISELDFNADPHLIKIKGSHRLKLEDDVPDAREKGIKMHSILSEVNSAEDLLPVLDKMIKKGLIKSTELDELSTKISAILSNPLLKPYFSGTLKSKNESEIITDTGELLRPDKIVFDDSAMVVIDYKTGKQDTRRYLEQMNKYEAALLKMGYSSVKKILVYIDENVVEAI
ncbi:MAG: UvrD-helicase domain-containing protein, partial [Bacteroidia bacterium]